MYGMKKIISSMKITFVIKIESSIESSLLNCMLNPLYFPNSPAVSIEADSMISRGFKIIYLLLVY